MKYLFLLFLSIIAINLNAQRLQPGFNVDECYTMMCISERQGDSTAYPLYGDSPNPFNRIYLSNPTALENQWEVWIAPGKVAAISLHGTKQKLSSWLENFYAAMVPARGSVITSDSTQFNYQFAENPRATVHAGWTFAMAFLYDDITQFMDSLYRNGYRDFLIVGHSQGGALAYLLRAALQHDRVWGNREARIKTYCLAPPKPGNLYFSYDFEYATQGGWSYRVVNELDWVPETPFSLQTLHDFNPGSPIPEADKAMTSLPFFARIFIRSAYHKMDKSTKRSVKKFRKYLGYKAFDQLQKFYPQAVQPKFSNSNNYSVCGSPIILKPDSTYKEMYKKKWEDAFTHHILKAYIHLIKVNF